MIYALLYLYLIVGGWVSGWMYWHGYQFRDCLWLGCNWWAIGAYKYPWVRRYLSWGIKRPSIYLYRETK